MQYLKYIESRFLIDEPKTGQLVPFKLRPVQKLYYDQLVADYDIENKGLNQPIREEILKARREGFSSLILALFAADDILQANPTETQVLSYKDDATNTFKKRYRLFILSSAAIKVGHKVEDIQKNPNILESFAKQVFSIDGSDLELSHNKAHFYCGTASARVGGRGGVLQKLLFSEAAHYPDSEKMTAKEIIDGTMRQVDIDSGWIFIESTANGYGNYYEQLWAQATKGESRFKPRFYGWRDFYSEDQFKLITSEFTDKTMLRQEYPETAEEAFIASGTGYFDNDRILTLIKKAPEPTEQGTIRLKCQHNEPCKTLLVCNSKKPLYTEETNGLLVIYKKPVEHTSYVLGGDVAEGVNGDYSVATIIDNKTLETVAVFSDKLSTPDVFTETVFALGAWYNYAYVGVEANKDGLWVNNQLFMMGYPNLYYREVFDDIAKTVSRKVGFKTDGVTRPYILTELRTILGTVDKWNDKVFLDECLTFVRNKVGKPAAMSGRHDDRVMATAIAVEIRRNAPEAFDKPLIIDQTNENKVLMRLEQLKRRNNTNVISQDAYI